MASLFDTLEVQAFRAGIPARTDKSRKWFQRKVKELGKVQQRKVLKDDALHKVNKPLIGDMVMYFYDPKLKVELPYYDRFPLTIMVQQAKGGFHGLNLHYFSPTVRALFLDELMKFGPCFWLFLRCNSFFSRVTETFLLFLKLNMDNSAINSIHI